MRVIRKLGVAELDPISLIMGRAYPGGRNFTTEGQKQLKERLARSMAEETHAAFYGLFQDQELQGVAKFYDFQMNVHGRLLPAGGVGSVAVDLLHKKEKVAKELITHFLRHYREKGVWLTMLYPFRPDFYRKMGFGAGTPMHLYAFKPESIRILADKRHLVNLGEDEREEWLQCYQRIARQTHGMLERTAYESRLLFANPEHLIAGCRIEGSLRGYIIYTFKPVSDSHFLANNLVIKEMGWENTGALHELLAFLRSQSDQVNRIILPTQDEAFYFLLDDPRNDSAALIPSVYHESFTAGIGLMYRVVDVKQAFRQLAWRDFGSQTCRLKLIVRDSFLPENNGSTVLHVRDGRVEVVEDGDWEAEAEMDIADFSSLLLGAVRFKHLRQYGLVNLSNPAFEACLDALFRTEEKPRCVTPF